MSAHPTAPPTATDPGLAALGALLDRSQLSTGEDLPGVVRAAAAHLGWGVTVHLVDYDQRRLVPMLPPGEGPREALSIEGTLAGRAFRTVEVLPAGSGGRWWVPLIDGAERLGVLEVVVDTHGEHGELSQGQLDRLRWFTSLVGHLVSVKVPYGDVITRLRGAAQRSVASELVWQMLPPLTFACEGLVVSGILEPCYQVGGDVFDYAVEGGTAHLAVFDATGHDLHAGVLSAVTLSTYRNARRRGADLHETARALDAAVEEHGRGERYVTGVVAQLDLGTGRLRYLAAGHPWPLLLRGTRVVKSLDGGRRPLLGLALPDVPLGEERLEPGDAVVVHTDGITEARDEAGALFGVERLVDGLERSAADGFPAPEMLRRLSHAVLAHQRGVLQDDATLLIAQWRGHEGEMPYPATTDELPAPPG